jgi:AcrR family transcriptional regulator
MLGEPIRDRRAERHEATRTEIIDVAWDVAREQGLAGLTLRDVARRVGMQAPSLYSYFASKNDIYDAMFGQAWTQCRDEIRAAYERLPDDPRAAIKEAAHMWFDFSVLDAARYLLMSQRTIPGFEPSPEAYQPAIDVIEDTKRMFKRYHITADYALDLNTAFVAGLVAQQVANDPGGDRWKKQVDRAMDAFCDAVGLPITEPRKATTRGNR